MTGGCPYCAGSRWEQEHGARICARCGAEFPVPGMAPACTMGAVCGEPDCPVCGKEQTA